ncbi:MAG: KpsF/GutQ family sugar-phosphate isomerase [Puniceicoccales bacterium]|jgi:arabinose-5-phosphate isomerase|nr:KpsF/GutQ family sugar-phosphate isomerase [Puniceicoccales bacterium]
MDTENFMQAARKLLCAEATALADLSTRLGKSFESAVALLLQHHGKVVVSGVGKSGLIAQKIAATLCSTGTPAVFLHSTDAMHGDIGIFQAGDPAILISKSGSTAEVVRLLPIIKQVGSPIIALVCNVNSPLAEQADVVIDLAVGVEADPLGLAPTTSALLTLAIGDALAAALMVARNFNATDFARFHPAGQLGRNLTMTVGEVMHPLSRVATVSPSLPFREIVIAMTTFSLGAGCVLDKQGRLAGLVTDGDLRRTLRKYENFSQLTAADFMTRKPVCAHPAMSLAEAVRLMEERPSQLSVLPVVEPASETCLGLLRIHDIYQASIV